MPRNERQTCKEVIEPALEAAGWSWQVQVRIGPGRVNLAGESMYDETQAIGRRYRRQDKLGTPYCVTVDFDSLEDEAVTIRERDSMAQERIPIAGLVDHLRAKLL